MIPLYNQLEFNKSKPEEKLQCECEVCHKIFYVTKHQIMRSFISNKHKINFCSQKCNGLSRYNKVEVKCLNCEKIFLKNPGEIKKSPNHFCCKSCSNSYNNTHKKYGIRRSKLEIYIEQELYKKYPDLIMEFNKKNTINSELDIYIPSLKLAFELNGIFHYEPIFGEEKLSKIINNDKRKFQACLEKKIELCIIDASSLKNFKELRAIKFLNIIENIINLKILNMSKNEK